MKITSTSLQAVLAAMMSVASTPFQQMPAKRYPSGAGRYAVGQKRSPAGSKLARKAAEKRLTGDLVSQYGRGLLNHFAGRRRTHSLV